MAGTSTAIALDDYGPDQEQRNVAASSRNEDESRYKCLLIFASWPCSKSSESIPRSVCFSKYLSNESFLPSDSSAAAVAFVGTLGLHPAY